GMEVQEEGLRPSSWRGLGQRPNKIFLSNIFLSNIFLSNIFLSNIFLSNILLSNIFLSEGSWTAFWKYGS
ncbi:MAG: hypothetical protein H7833_19260, partial [Magnetococcus sp. DMHC-1]